MPYTTIYGVTTKPCMSISKPNVCFYALAANSLKDAPKVMLTQLENVTSSLVSLCCFSDIVSRWRQG